jgi:hypothetical protein
MLAIDHVLGVAVLVGLLCVLAGLVYSLVGLLKLRKMQLREDARDKPNARS